ncbi:MAG: hypothetical protein IKM59_02135 [Oscillospiraceae bacterium]|nr:hypothetical protein [Oscillospiraceae bacterium]
MKKIFSLILAVLLALSTLSAANANVQQSPNSRQVIPMDDGGYMVIEINNSPTLTRAGTTSLSKYYNRYNEDNMLVWRATLTGYFTYDGRTATCTSCTCSVTNFADGWYNISKTVWPDENIAKATLEMGRRTLGITVQRETHNLSMVCDRYGNVS